MYTSMKKVIIILSITTLILSGCSKATSKKVGVENQLEPFYVNVVDFADLQQEASLERHGKVIGENDIIVTSQVAARVEDIPVNIGEKVKKDWLIIKLSDSTGSYSFAVQRAKAWLESARINYESTKISLEKAISDTSLGIQQAETQYAAADLQGEWSSALQIQQLKKQVNKAELDYQTQLTSNQQTINNFIETAANIGKDIELLFQSVRIESDSILGISKLYEKENDLFERHLGVKNTSTRRIANQELRTLLSKETNYNNLSRKVAKEDLTTYLDELKILLYDMRPVLEAIDTMLQYSNTSTDFTETQLMGLVATIDGLQTQIQGQISLITAQINSIQSFLTTYQAQEESLRQQVEIIKEQAASTERSINDGATTANIGLQNATNNYDTALKSKNTTLAALANSIDQATIAYNQANNELSKLQVVAPIDGTIGDILVDVWQEVTPGTPLFTISSTNEQQIEITLGASELDLVTIWQEVTIQNSETLSGTLVSVSKIADRNFTYKAIIQINKTINIFGELVDVTIPVTHSYPLIPITNLTILNTSEWLLSTRDGKGLQEIQVQLGKVRRDQIEILSDIDPTTQVITSDINNFDENKYELTLKN